MKFRRTRLPFKLAIFIRDSPDVPGTGFQLKTYYSPQSSVLRELDPVREELLELIKTVDQQSDPSDGS